MLLNMDKMCYHLNPNAKRLNVTPHHTNKSRKITKHNAVTEEKEKEEEEGTTKSMIGSD